MSFDVSNRRLPSASGVAISGMGKKVELVDPLVVEKNISALAHKLAVYFYTRLLRSSRFEVWNVLLRMVEPEMLYLLEMILLTFERRRSVGRRIRPDTKCTRTS